MYVVYHGIYVNGTVVNNVIHAMFTKIIDYCCLKTKNK